MFTVITTIHIDDDKIANALCSAADGGITRWVGKCRRSNPDTWTPDSKLVFDRYGWFAGVVLGGGAVMITPIDEESREYRLDRAAIADGLKLMAEHYPNQLRDLHTENDDAVTADTLVQLALFGKVHFG